MAGAHSVISVSDLDMVEISEDSHSLPDTFSCDENGDDDESNFTPEIQQAYKIFQSFLLEKHKSVTAPFWLPIWNQTENSMTFKEIDNKFVKREYESITEFVADFRLMLENCYRFHGVEHWISKQAQKLEHLLEQKLTLLSRSLREKTTLAVTSRGRFGIEDEKETVGTSNRRRSTPRNLTCITAGGTESLMVQALRLEEQQKAKVDKRQRDLEKKEAGEASVKEVEEWERSLLLPAEPWPIDIMWELPAIGHFLCLAQTALNLPEIVFFELERCLLMPRCSSFLAKVMTSLLCPPHRRMTLHRRPALVYRRWEAELRKKVLGLYQSVGRSRDQEACAEQLGLCHRFFWTLGESSPLEEKPFHLLPFNQRVWLLKGLCDNVYETQKDVQNAVLGQPIHECRESILGYDSQENAYIHFPHFCGADLRIYCQSPCIPLEFPLPPFCVKKMEPKMLDLTKVNLITCPEVRGKNSHIFYSELLNDECTGEHEPEQKGSGKYRPFGNEDLPGPESAVEEPMEVDLQLKDEGNWDSDCEPCLRVEKNPYTQIFHDSCLSTEAFRASLQSAGNAPQNNQTPCHHSSLCPKCCSNLHDKPESHTCFCFKDVSERIGPVAPQPKGHLKAETGRVCAKKRKRIKSKEQSLGLKKLRRTRAAKNSPHKTVFNLKRKDKRKKPKLGRKLVPKKIGEKERQKEPPQPPAEPTFKLVCTNLDDLRALINKTEDELDELESNKKRCFLPQLLASQVKGQWCIKKAAVKELHITLIRLLNELLPWEPKLLKAFQKNRARLKKECDDFKKHPEYENFVREELYVAEEEGDACSEGSLLTEIDKDLKKEEHFESTLRRDSGETDCENHHGNVLLGCLVSRPDVITDLSASRPWTRSTKHYHDFSLGRKEKIVVYDSVPSEAEDTSGDHNTTGTNPLTAERPSVFMAPLGGFQRRCKPIQALLAKSVGNKVTLMSHPQAAANAQTFQLPNKTVCTALTSTKLAIGHSLPQPTPDPVPQSEPPHKISSQTQTLTMSSAQISSKGPESLNSVRNDGPPVKFSMQPVMDIKPGEKVMQQVIILPKKLLIQKSEEQGAQQSSNTSPAFTSKTNTLLSITPGFAVPENRTSVQQIAPLKDISTVVTHSSADSPSIQRSSSACKKTTESSSALKQNPASTLVPSNPKKGDFKQELKTVCIRDSQSILVTTRGGNTGVVKVQISEQSGQSALPPTHIFTLPPQFQAFLMSKSPASAQTGQTTPANMAPVNSAPLDTKTSLSLKSVRQMNLPPLNEKTNGTLIANKDAHDPVGSFMTNATENSQTLIDVNAIRPSTFQTNVSVPLTVQNTACKHITRPPQKRLPVTSIVADQSPLRKVFRITPTSSTSASALTFTTTSTGSSVMFMSPCDSACSTVTVAKGSLPFGSSITAATTQTAAEIMKVKPKLGHTIGSTTTATTTRVHGINISGLTARILNETTVTSETLTQAATNITPVIVSSVGTSTNRPFLVQNSQPASSSCSTVNATGSVRATKFDDGKTVVFTTYDTRHMASSALLSKVQQTSVSSSASTTVSISNLLNNKSEMVVSTTAPNTAYPLLGSPINKCATLPRGLMLDKSRGYTSLTTASSTTTADSVSGVSETPSTTMTTGSPFMALQPIVTPPVVTSPVYAITGSPTVQEKILINTPAPLAPGTQLLFNNTMFVVPAPGLGPGQHVLLISGPAVHGPLVTPSVPSGTATPIPKTLTPGMQSPPMSVKLPTLPTATLRPTVPVQLFTAGRPSMVCADSTVFAQVTQFESPVSSGQQNLTSVMKRPSFLHHEGKDSFVAPLNNNAIQKETVAGSVQSQQHSPSTVTPAGLLNTTQKPQVTTVTSVKTGTSLVGTASAMSCTASRIQTLPVGTVPPNGSASGQQVTCVSTVSPAVNKLVMATCQPVKAIQAGNNRMPGVSHLLQSKVIIPAQIPAEPTNQPACKLLLSPDGAILNVVSNPVLQNLPLVTSAVTAGTVSSADVLETRDSQRMLTLDNREGQNH